MCKFWLQFFLLYPLPILLAFCLSFVSSLLLFCGSFLKICSSYFYSYSSVTAVRGEPQYLPKLPSNALGPATYVSSSSRPSSLDLPQLTQATSTYVFLNVECLWFKNSKLSATIQFMHSEELSQPRHSSYFYHLNYVQFNVERVQLIIVPCFYIAVSLIES
jgi:hypothetical protein